MRFLGIGVLVLCMATVAFADSGTTTAPAAKTAPSKANTVIGDKAMMQIDDFIAKAKIDKSKADWKTTLPKPDTLKFDPSHTYFARMVTNKGTILIQFKPKVAPMHVTSFIYLSKLGFYDGLKFHRVIQNFMAQGGDPLGNGKGGPGYQYAGEFGPAAKHDKAGILSTANAGPGTDGSQFFITFKPLPQLDGSYTVFGEVVEGLDTVKKLEAAGSADGSGTTSEPLQIEKVTIEVK